MNKLVILTGLRANNDLHLGNYLGALLPIVKMQHEHAGEYTINLFVPDLHSFTTPIDHSKLYEQSLNNLRVFAAAGLDLMNDDTYIYRQSYIPAHSELTVILNSFAYMGELNRMTQFKEKGDGKANVSVGLFDYPVLMTADILLYGATYVPVGADQTQHVELARDIAIRMNNKFGDLFTLPEAEKEQIAFTSSTERLRIRDLGSPEKKMSKSDESGKGVIFLSDTPEVAAKKIMSATTDSIGSIAYDKAERPGISNLMDILAALTNTPIDKIIEKYQGQTQYGPLKTDVAEATKAFLSDFQSKLNAVDESVLQAKLEASENAMNIVANETLHRVQKAVGLRK
jgi:tryptophanyl-tRNA synthetase